MDKISSYPLIRATISPCYLKKKAKKALHCLWAQALLLTLGITLLSVGVFMLPSIFRWIIDTLFISVLSIGISFIFMDIYAQKKISIGETLLSLFRNNYLKIIGGLILITFLFSIGLLLLIIPGIVTLLGFSMTFFILRDNPQLNILEAMKRSWKMTSGYKMNLFFLLCSFSGWLLLVILPGLILLIAIQFQQSGLLISLCGAILAPYFNTALTGFYIELKKLETPPPVPCLHKESTEEQPNPFKPELIY